MFFGRDLQGQPRILRGIPRRKFVLGQCNCNDGTGMTTAKFVELCSPPTTANHKPRRHQK